MKQRATSCITYEDIRRIIIIAVIGATIFAVCMAGELIQITRNAASAHDLKALGCSINADLLQGVAERRVLVSTTTFPAIEGDIKARRLKQLDDSAARLQLIEKKCIADRVPREYFTAMVAGSDQ